MARTVDRKKLAEWQRRFARHRTSGLTVAEFCRREGVEAGRWKYWQRQVERLTATEPRQAAARAVFQAVEIIPRRAVVVRFPGGTTLESERPPRPSRPPLGSDRLPAAQPRLATRRRARLIVFASARERRSSTR